jgi:DNA polymerase-3 subunit delta
MVNYRQIIQQVESGKLEKVYVFHGEEPFFIDAITEVILDKALPEQDRAFDQVVLYGKDVDALSLQSELKNFPMLAEKKLVVLKEAQDMKQFDELSPYFAQPSDRTIFVVNYKYKTIDARKKLLKDAAKNGIVFKSEKVKEYQLVEWISGYVKSTGFGITSKAAMLLAEFLGNDLGKIVNEIGKLQIILAAGTTINDVHIEENIGISKDYNIYELNNALANRDSYKAMKIVDYFKHNPKAGEAGGIIASLFRLYAQLMRVHFAKVKSPDQIAAQLKVPPFAAGEIIKQSKNYDARKLAQNIGILYEYDLKSKGLGASPMTDKGDMMFEMVYRLLN